MPPRGIPHAQRRVVPRTGSVLIVVSPAGLEGFFHELAAADRAGELGPGAYARVAALRHHLAERRSERGAPRQIELTPLAAAQGEARPAQRFRKPIAHRIRTGEASTGRSKPESLRTAGERGSRLLGQWRISDKARVAEAGQT